MGQLKHHIMCSSIALHYRVSLLYKIQIPIVKCSRLPSKYKCDEVHVHNIHDSHVYRWINIIRHIKQRVQFIYCYYLITFSVLLPSTKPSN